MQLTLPSSIKQLNSSGTKSFKFFDKHIYQKDNLIIRYRNSSYSPDIPGYPSDVMSLEEREKELHIYSKNRTVFDSSKIITINNIRFLIVEYHNYVDDGIRHLSFLSDSDKKHRYIGGGIEFKKSDEEKAWAFLNEFLHSMHFKEK